MRKIYLIQTVSLVSICMPQVTISITNNDDTFSVMNSISDIRENQLKAQGIWSIYPRNFSKCNSLCMCRELNFYRRVCLAWGTCLV